MEERIRKTYQSIRYPYFYTNVVIDGVTIRIAFEGTARRGAYYVNGKYSTSDPKIQEELEKSPSLNVEYRLISQQALKGSPEEETPIPNGQNPVIDNNPQSGIIPKITIIPEITRVQDARDWLVKNIKEVSSRMVRNREQVLKAAKDYKVQFPNLK